MVRYSLVLQDFLQPDDLRGDLLQTRSGVVFEDEFLEFHELLPQSDFHSEDKLADGNREAFGLRFLFELEYFLQFLHRYFLLLGNDVLGVDVLEQLEDGLLLLVVVIVEVERNVGGDFEVLDGGFQVDGLGEVVVVGALLGLGAAGIVDGPDGGGFEVEKLLFGVSVGETELGLLGETFLQIKL